MKALIACALSIALAGCGAPPAPVLSAAAAGRLVVAAAAAADAARATGETAALRELFSSNAAAPLLRRVRQLERAGDRLERQADRRRLVHLGSGEAVLEVLGAERLVHRGRPAGWTRYARQWDASLAFDGTRWRVSRASDLPPERWWR